MSRILILTNLFPTESTPWGGEFIRSRTDALAEGGHNVDVVALVPARPRTLRAALALLGRTGAAHSALPEPPFQAVHVPMSTWGYLLAWRGRFPRRAVQKAARLVRRSLGSVDYDAVIAHGMYMLPAGSVARELVGPGNYAVVCHGSDVNRLMPHRSHEYADALDGARSAIFVSGALAIVARELGMTRTSGVVIVPNGVDTEMFRPDRREPARDRLGWRGRRVALFVGSLTEIKGADRLPALARLLAAGDDGIVTAVAGDGPLGKSLRAEAPPSMKFLGRLGHEEVADVLAAADVLLIPSRNEGWPTVIMEAYASGTKVVGTAVGGVTEALQGHGAAVVDTPGVEGLLAEAAMQALDAGRNPEGLRAIAKAHSWRDVVEQELGAALP
jgi:teichuronic acid biosynthesis glycosyltransferase TuaC